MMKYSAIKRIRFSVLLLALLFMGAIALTSCNALKIKSATAQVPQVVTSLLSDPKTFNPPLVQEAPSPTSVMFEGLVTENGLTGKIEPALAESWTISEDKKKIVFTIKPNLKWSDGKPLTVDDVVFTYNEIYLNEAIPTDTRDVLRIGKNRALPTVKKLDGSRVEFTVPEPFAPFLRVTGVPILPAHILRKYVNEKNRDGKPVFLTTWGVNTPPNEIVVNGPYALERYDTSQRIIFKRNPYFWRKDSQGRQQPYIERMVWQIVESTDVSLMQFRSGSLDSIAISPDIFSLVKREEKRGNFTIYNGGPASGTTFISFNLNKAKNGKGQPIVNPIKSRWFNTKEFRQAVAYAIDRQTMINNTFRGLGKPQNSPISVQSPYYLSPEKGLKVYNYNTAKAKELLLKAGFKYNADGQLLDWDGNRVRFTLMTNSGNKIREAMGAQIKQDLSKIGIQVDFTPINFGTLVDKLSNTRDWECYLLGLTGGVEPNDGANVWNSTGGLHSFNQGPTPGEPPINGWVVSDWEKEIDRLMIAGAQELDETKRKEIYAQFQNIVQEEVPVIYLVNQLSLAAVRNRIKGIKYSALGGAFWNIYELPLTEN
ncbi:ABC transporter substrate-binding protein [Aerosakkonemataceae cyanobacterium BLCC-F50]|uniref:ABC transporter substrate-binding protein n=1 Tax=Floridaenema flaviceps BLCC-F50 TaxID=3153642 RepID=A0ABV4Y2M4_9CYAN